MISSLVALGGRTFLCGRTTDDVNWFRENWFGMPMVAILSRMDGEHRRSVSMGRNAICKGKDMPWPRYHFLPTPQGRAIRMTFANPLSMSVDAQPQAETKDDDASECESSNDHWC